MSSRRRITVRDERPRSNRPSMMPTSESCARSLIPGTIVYRIMSAVEVEARSIRRSTTVFLRTFIAGSVGFSGGVPGEPPGSFSSSLILKYVLSGMVTCRRGAQPAWPSAPPRSGCSDPCCSGSCRSRLPGSSAGDPSRTEQPTPGRRSDRTAAQNMRRSG